MTLLLKIPFESSQRIKICNFCLIAIFSKGNKLGRLLEATGLLTGKWARFFCLDTGLCYIKTFPKENGENLRKLFRQWKYSRMSFQKIPITIESLKGNRKEKRLRFLCHIWKIVSFGYCVSVMFTDWISVKVEVPVYDEFVGIQLIV